MYCATYTVQILSYKQSVCDLYFLLLLEKWSVGYSIISWQYCNTIAQLLQLRCH